VLGSMENLNQIAEGLRSVLQDMLRGFVRDKAERERLAKVIGRTPAHIKQMIYQGEGGLDSWVKAFAYYYKIDLNGLDSLKTNLRKKVPVAQSDELWFRIRDHLGAEENDLLYLAKCAHEAYRIKCELDAAVVKRRARRRVPNS
jgi:hypothetical protein